MNLQYVNTETSSISLVWEYWNHHHLYIQYRNTKSPSSVSIFKSKGPDISFQSHMASQLSRAICYVFCFSCAKRSTGLFPVKPWTHNRPKIIYMMCFSYLRYFQLNLNMYSHTIYSHGYRPKSIVPFRYLITCFAATRWTRLGWTRYWIKVFIAKQMYGLLFVKYINDPKIYL